MKNSSRPLPRRGLLKALRLLLSCLLLVSGHTFAQSAPRLSVTGRILVDGNAFTGSGAFRFALIDGAGSLVWASDGSTFPAATGAPAAAVTVPVVSGQYALQLGDASLANMTTLPPPGTLYRSRLVLHTWFSDGSHGVQKIGTEPLTTVAYSLMALTIPDGSATTESLAPGSATTSALAPAAITSDRIPPAAAQAALAASDLGQVPVNGIILSDDPVSPSLQAAGFTRLLYKDTVTPSGWTQKSGTGAPSARARHTAVWTGSEMIIFGGLDAAGVPLATGARYNPATDTWTALPTAGATAHAFHTAVWTGTEMIVYGGLATASVRTSAGEKFNPATGTWTALPTTGAPSPRTTHSAAWSGTDMFIVGGYDGTTHSAQLGARYTPSTNTWTALPTTAPAPGPRYFCAAVWIGADLLVWGGASGPASNVPETGGARFSPATSIWTALPPAPAAITQPVVLDAAWTGTGMLAWLGSHGATVRFSPATAQWAYSRPLHAGLITGFPRTVWTGQELLLFDDNAGSLAGCAAWIPSLDALIPLPQKPAARSFAPLVWTGSQALVFGGYSPAPSADLWSLIPPRTAWFYQKK